MKIANKKYQIFDKPSNSELFSRNFEVIEQSGNQATAIFRNKLSFKQLFLRCLPFSGNNVSEYTALFLEVITKN